MTVAARSSVRREGYSIGAVVVEKFAPVAAAWTIVT
jgi:hypothetical protein